MMDPDHWHSVPDRTREARPCARSARRCLCCVLVLLGGGFISVAARAVAAGAVCADSLASAPLVRDGRATLRGTVPAEWGVPAQAGRTYLFEASLEGNDAVMDVEGVGKRPLARADHPERRSGTRRAIVTFASAEPVTLRVTGTEHEAVVGSVQLRVLDLSALDPATPCATALRLLAAADADFALGRDVSRGLRRSPAVNARHAFLRAAEGYLAAHQVLEPTDDVALRGSAALALAGVAYFNLFDWTRATEWAERAGRELATSDPYRRARADAIRAAAWMEVASGAPRDRPIPGIGVDVDTLFARTGDLLEQLARFHLARGERYDAALQVNNQGLARYYAARYAECRAPFDRAAHMFRELHELQREALAVQNLGNCEWGAGRLALALRHNLAALKMMQREPSGWFYAVTLNNAASLMFALGDIDGALRRNGEALALGRTIQSPRIIAQSLFGLGEAYYALGELPRARQFLESSLGIRTVASDPRGRVATLRALATIDADEGRAAAALDRDREALALAATPFVAVKIRLQFAAHLLLAGQPLPARQALDAIIGSDAPAERFVRGQALLARATVERSTGDLGGAARDLARARPLLTEFGTEADVYGLEFETACVARARANLPEALAAVDRALGHAAALRLRSANPELRAGLQQPLRRAYALKVDLLWERYSAALLAHQADAAEETARAAFDAADVSRARAFSDLAAAQFPASLRDALKAQFERRDALYRRIAELRVVLEENAETAGAVDARSSTLRAQVGELEHALDTVNSEISARAAAVSGATGRAARRAAETAAAADGALLSYWLGPRDAYAWVVTEGRVHWVRLGEAAAVAGRARALYGDFAGLVRVSRAARLAAAAEVYALILQPLEPWIGGVRTLRIVPDAELNFIPFAALRYADGRGEHFVVEAHDVAYVPAAWMLTTRTRTPRGDGGRLLLVADPVYERGDPRLRAGGRAASTRQDAMRPELASLRGARGEAAAIAGHFPTDAVDRFEGLAATRERLLGLDWKRYRYIHFATHAVAYPSRVEFSSLQLSRYDAGGREIESDLRMADIGTLTLDADVVVFSACETALGKNVPGEGLLGLSYATLARGGRAVVASLWPVPDEMGTTLMTEFYRHLVDEGAGPEAALGAAMRDILGRDPHADPAIWAPFQASVLAIRRPDESGARAQARPNGNTDQEML